MVGGSGTGAVRWTWRHNRVACVLWLKPATYRAVPLTTSCWKRGESQENPAAWPTTPPTPALPCQPREQGHLRGHRPVNPQPRLRAGRRPRLLEVPTRPRWWDGRWAEAASCAPGGPRLKPLVWRVSGTPRPGQWLVRFPRKKKEGRRPQGSPPRGGTRPVRGAGRQVHPPSPGKSTCGKQAAVTPEDMAPLSCFHDKQRKRRSTEPRAPPARAVGTLGLGAGAAIASAPPPPREGQG